MEDPVQNFGKGGSMDRIKKRNRYRNYLSIQVFVFVGVMTSFQVIADRAIAALVASALFFLGSFTILWIEQKHPGFFKRPSFLMTAAFLFFFVIPIFLMRVLNWGQEFATIEYFGVTGKMLHETSSKFFVVMLATYFADSILEKNRALIADQSPKEKENQNLE